MLNALPRHVEVDGCNSHLMRQHGKLMDVVLHCCREACLRRGRRVGADGCCCCLQVDLPDAQVETRSGVDRGWQTRRFGDR